MTTAQIEWMPYFELTDGLRFFPLSKRNDGGPDSWFTDKTKPMIAIADDSGREPQDTDDGLLWLDFGRNLYGAGAKDSGYPPLIPLLMDDGTETKTATDEPTMLMLSHKYRWKINSHGLLFTASRVIV